MEIKANTCCLQSGEEKPQHLRNSVYCASKLPLIWDVELKRRIHLTNRGLLSMNRFLRSKRNEPFYNHLPKDAAKLQLMKLMNQPTRTTSTSCSCSMVGLQPALVKEKQINSITSSHLTDLLRSNLTSGERLKGKELSLILISN